MADQASPRLPSPSPSPSPSPVPMGPLVGSQFCAPNKVALTLTKKAISLSGGDFVVSDVNASPIMKASGHAISLHSHRLICDAAGTPIITLRKKYMSFHNKWRVYQGDSSDHDDLLFTIKLQKQLLFEVFLAKNTDERCCDFKLKRKATANTKSLSFYLADTDTAIAVMCNQCGLLSLLPGMDLSFGLTVSPHVDYAFVVTILVVLFASQTSDATEKASSASFDILSSLFFN